MKTYTINGKTACEMCRRRVATRFNETMRVSGGGGKIVDLCKRCMDKLPAINRRNR